MKTQEFIKTMKTNNGFLHLFLNLILLGCFVALCIYTGRQSLIGLSVAIAIIGFIFWLIHLIGLCIIRPNESRVLTFFGKYSGTIKQNGFFWVNPFYSKRNLSLRARNMNVEPIKVNDKNGNPIMIGLVLVWKIKDTYKACFDIDSEVAPAVETSNRQHLKSYDKFVNVQSDAALRKVAGLYAYDHIDNKSDEITLRSGSEEINERLEQTIRERLEIAGIEVVEARINNLAYASEIASVMLRRQQAEAIISAREKIVEGAVSMVELALNRLEKDGVVDLDNEKKAAMVSHLMVVLCADEAAKPVINTGSLY
ncbi:MAG: SPFH domain-containing protein [Bacteroidales bacterium]|jgi:regulator of protease activity HflC (stomatin/prohibitin superfamily)|nr:SPFH domain-containing protein [Bacteroidales bacterium]